jgi:hypothetical protein
VEDWEMAEMETSLEPTVWIIGEDCKSRMFIESKALMKKYDGIGYNSRRIRSVEEDRRENAYTGRCGSTY